MKVAGYWALKKMSAGKKIITVAAKSTNLRAIRQWAIPVNRQSIPKPSGVDEIASTS
ncbi:MAG TPA: hypothetical protein VJN89_02525 [Candidatus Acidoferrum sp.]|nr:hypothetical protein [Candidatus Acidoferrum sp.]